jgi:hypothetical protein
LGNLCSTDKLVVVELAGVVVLANLEAGGRLKLQ